MKIHFERTGGFAGRRVTATIDSSTLEADEARRLRELVDASGLFDLPQAATAPAGGADRLRYKVTVEAEERRHTVEIDEAAAPPALRHLLERLNAEATRPPRP